MFKQEHQLNWPIEDDKSQPVKTVVINTLTMGQHREFSQQHNDEDSKLLRVCISASSGLTVAELKRLTTPDYTSIENQVLELMHFKASQLMDSGEFDIDEPTLLVPFTGDDGLEKTAYKLRPPTVATTDLMDTHKDEWDRTLFISSSCTGFSPDELARMSLPDWNQLQERLIDFLQKSADFFRQKTLKS
mgnify:CR=1 FL=1